MKPEAGKSFRGVSDQFYFCLLVYSEAGDSEVVVVVIVSQYGPQILGQNVSGSDIYTYIYITVCCVILVLLPAFIMCAEFHYKQVKLFQRRESIWGRGGFYVYSYLHL
jgi:hypothetical protein